MKVARIGAMLSPTVEINDFLDLKFIKDHFELNNKGDLVQIKDFRNHLKYRYAQPVEVRKDLAGEKYITIADRDYLLCGLIAAISSNKEVKNKKIYFRNEDSNCLDPRNLVVRNF